MTDDDITLTPEAQAQARQLQQQIPTFAEALLSVRWLLVRNPLLGAESYLQGHRILRQRRAPGRPGIRVTYRYSAGKIVIVALEQLTP